MIDCLGQSPLTKAPEKKMTNPDFFFALHNIHLIVMLSVLYSVNAVVVGWS